MLPMICRLGEWWFRGGVFLSRLLPAPPALVPFLLPSVPSVGPFSPESARLPWIPSLSVSSVQRAWSAASFPNGAWVQHGPHRPGSCQDRRCILILRLPRCNLGWIPTRRSRRLCAYVKVVFRRYRRLVNDAVAREGTYRPWWPVGPGGWGGPAGGLIPEGTVLQA